MHCVSHGDQASGEKPPPGQHKNKVEKRAEPPAARCATLKAGCGCALPLVPRVKSHPLYGKIRSKIILKTCLLNPLFQIRQTFETRQSSRRQKLNSCDNSCDNSSFFLREPLRQPHRLCGHVCDGFQGSLSPLFKRLCAKAFFPKRAGDII